MFGTMFGDAGHGFCLILLALSFYMTNKNENINGIRSMLLIMGIFSFYCGLIYNDFLSIPLPLFNSCYKKEEENFSRLQNCTYTFGFDYNWHLSTNSLAFLNSFKMKISIVIGVAHMTIGILMKGLNSIQFKEYLIFFFEFVPQIVFFISTFGYMVFCIFVKWTNNY